jgi:hypothetical protein
MHITVPTFQNTQVFLKFRARLIRPKNHSGGNFASLKLQVRRQGDFKDRK